MSFLSPLLDLLKRSKPKASPTAGSPPPIAIRPRQVAATEGTRPRYAGAPPSEYEKLKDRQVWNQTAPLYGDEESDVKKPAWWKGALYGALKSAGAGANQAMAQGNVGWGGVGQALGAGAGGAVGGAINPEILLKDRRDREIAETQGQLDQQMQQMGNEAQLEDLKARAEDRTAQAEERRRKPEVELQKRRDAQEEETWKRGMEERRVSVSERLAAGTLNKHEADAEMARIKFEEDRRHNMATEPGGKDNEDKIGEATNKRQALLNQASTLYKKAANNEQNAQKLEDSIKTFPEDTYAGQQEREGRKKEADRLRQEARDWRVTGDKARSDGESVYVPKARAGAPAPSTHKVSKAAWIASHPGGDWNEAKRVAEARQYKIVD